MPVSILFLTIYHCLKFPASSVSKLLASLYNKCDWLDSFNLAANKLQRFLNSGPRKQLYVKGYFKGHNIHMQATS